MVHIKVTKSLLKTLEDLERLAEKVNDSKTQKGLRSVVKKLQKACKVQQGGADVDLLTGTSSVDPRIYNVQGLISNADPLETTISVSHLEHVPAPFSAGNNMMDQGLLSESQVNDFVPKTYETIQGGGKKKTKGNTKTKKVNKK